jgi:flagellar protein FliS
MSDAIATASPARLLTMLYDRLHRDVTQAGEDLAAGSDESAEAALRHAQEIVIELSASLNLTVWPDGLSLAHLYQFLLGELISANIHKDPERVASCLQIIEPLRATWHEVAMAATVATVAEA